jgi:flotillin
MMSFLGVVILVAAVVLGVLLPMLFRVVVDTNKVHIVQSRKKTTSYGTGQSSGNVYYKWPSWVPAVGVSRIVLPVNNFDLNLHGYKAYDKERVPFELDVTAFFRIADTNKAAERVATVDDLRKQLEYIVQGAVRKILASHDINQIMIDRATFGEQFTEEVKAELTNWGVEPVKNMELMDIRDADNSNVITNIMAKKASHIEMESRTEVARNNQAAQTAEIEALRAVNVAEQDAAQQVGQRTADKEKAIGIAQQKAQQDIKAEEALTAQKQMEVARVEQVKQAEINRDAAIVLGEQQKRVAILAAEGQLEATKRRAEGTKTEGEAKAAAEQAMQMAPVQAQIALAKEIGSSAAYQQYLVALEAVKAYISVGGEQAKALAAADIKVIANSGTPSGGLKNAMQLFSAQGGTEIGAMLEGLNQMPEGSALLDGLKRVLDGKAAGGGAVETAQRLQVNGKSGGAVKKG